MTISQSDTLWFVNSGAYMTRYEPIVATADGLRASLEQVIELTSFDRYAAQANDVFQMRDRLQRARYDHEVALEALMSCVEVAQGLDDEGLLPLILQALSSAERCVVLSAEQTTALIQGLNALMQSAAALGDDLLQRLLDMRTPALRALAVHHLDPNTVAHLNMLRVLLSSPCASTRRYARRIVQERATAPWWFGWFRSDPISRGLPLTQTQRHHLRALQLALRTPQLDLADILAHTTHHVIELPDELVVEFARFTLADPTAAHGAGRQLGAHLLVCTNGLDIATELLAGWAQQRDGNGAANILAALLSELPHGQRAHLCTKLLNRATSAPEAERVSFESVASLLAATVAQAWPIAQESTPLLRAIHGAHTQRPDQLNAIAIQLVEALPRLDPSTLPWELLLDFISQGFTGPWATAEPYLEGLLKQLPTEQAAPLMDRLLEQGSHPIAGWALEQIATLGLWNKDNPEDTGDRFLREQGLRTLLFQTPAVLKALLPRLRAELSGGRCSLTEAAHLMRALRDTSRHHFMSGAQIHLFATADSYHATPSHSSGPTAAEWNAWRSLRDAHPQRDSAFWDMALSLLPTVGRWTEADHALLDEARAASYPANIIKLAVALKARSTPDDTQHLRALVASSSGHMRRMLTAIAEQKALGS